VLFLGRSWSSLVLHPLDVKGSVELFLSSLNHYAVSVPQEQVGHCIQMYISLRELKSSFVPPGVFNFKRSAAGVFMGAFTVLS